MINKLLNKIEEYNTIIIHRHNRPDGDALGTQIGLCLSLREKFPHKNIYMVGDSNPRITFLGEMDQIEDNVYKNALVIIVDVAVSYMISDDRYKLAKEVFIIDHHKNKSDIEENNLIIDINCDILGDSVIMKTITTADATFEIQRGMEIGRDFEKTFNKKLEIL